MRRLAVFALVLVSANLATSAALARPSVVGGRDATRPYLFMASLQSNTGSHFCGGSLVRPNWILTAKHCVTGRNPNSFRVMLGSQKLSAPGEIHEIAQVLTDPNANSDSALLRLKVSSTLPPIRIAGLDEKATWAPGTLATAIGWGTTQYLVGPAPDQLQEVEVHVVSDSDCATPNGLVLGFNPATEVCAGEVTGLKDTCQGDSGGPLMVPDAGGRFIVFGTTYSGLGCGTPGGFYGIYARVGDTTIHSWLDGVLPPEASLSTGNAAVTEGGAGSTSTLTFTLTKSGTTAKTVSVDFRTVDGSATANSDYVPASGTLTFGPDDTTATVLVTIIGDAVPEGDETFALELSNAVNASIQLGSVTGTIRDDD